MQLNLRLRAFYHATPMRKLHLISIPASLLAAAALCALAAAPSANAGERMSLSRAAGSPETPALLGRFYGTPFDPKKLEGEVQQALQRSPDDGNLHEMAAYLAILKADDHAALLHFLRAALDVSSAAPEGLPLEPLQRHAGTGRPHHPGPARSSPRSTPTPR